MARVVLKLYFIKISRNFLFIIYLGTVNYNVVLM